MVTKKRSLGRAVDQGSLGVKTGTVAGAFPGVLFWIPDKLAAHVGTAAVFFTNAGQKTFSRFNGMDHELHRRGSKVEA